MPEVLLGIGPERFAELAAGAMTPKPPPVVGLDHVHAPRVSVREHAIVIRERVRRIGSTTFRALCADCESTLEVVARFLALLELYRDGVVGFDQVQALGELHVRWTGSDADGAAAETDTEIDEYGDEPAEVSSGDTTLGGSGETAPGEEQQ
jgi:segregation and condensation protein A